MKEKEILTTTGRPGVRKYIAIISASALIVLGGCGSSETPTNADTQTPDPAVYWPVSRCDVQATYEIAADVLSMEELISRVHEDDVELFMELFYPSDHAKAGELIPIREWERGQVRAWDKFHSVPGNLNDLLAATYDRVIEEFTPAEFLDRAHPEIAHRAPDILFPEGHPNAGDFVPSAEWEPRHSLLWEYMLYTRPAGPTGCPW